MLAKFNSVKSFFWRVTEKRAPRAQKVTLAHRSIYVLPSKAGLGYALVAVLLWLLGTNYENNLILASSFLLFALFIVSVLHAYRNLAGVQLQVLSANPGFAGERIELPVEMSAPRGSVHLQLQYPGTAAIRCDLEKNRPHTLRVPLLAERRGWLSPGRLLLKSYYPLGITRVWSWVFLKSEILVYPQPKPAVLNLNYPGGEEGDLGDRVKADDDFMGFSRYQAGAPLSQVAWKLYARGAGLQLKEFAAGQRQGVWLDFAALEGTTEDRLSGLCYLALQWHCEEREFGLLLPGVRIELASGERHLHQVLKELALYKGGEHAGG
ncbi:DUF58 domain-containing protein [Gilvimarinus sp. DA14]|uniref:DUF58 domain-containing protein n=1 Tax=Gilvimarinus sp. DA14 TaxID=2956798 RepID=UPI0020B8BD04|nr:DUF58 domain-containing protein [Gilvimarinus sp. DA14]UTF60976.1 DUF58 domain-containing protein [Gilvimarinus sp. DA14]